MVQEIIEIFIVLLMLEKSENVIKLHLLTIASMTEQNLQT